MGTREQALAHAQGKFNPGVDDSATPPSVLAEQVAEKMDGTAVGRLLWGSTESRLGTSRDHFVNRLAEDIEANPDVPVATLGERLAERLKAAGGGGAGAWRASPGRCAHRRRAATDREGISGIGDQGRPVRGGQQAGR